MRGFLKKLHKDGALQLVEPSDEVRTAYLKKSESYLVSAKLLLDHDRKYMNKEFRLMKNHTLNVSGNS